MQLLNPTERKFANGFAHSIELFTIINLDTSYNTMYTLNQMFPPRKLELLDTPPLILDMTLAQNVGISMFFTIDGMTMLPLVWAQFLETIRKGMATIDCAKKLQQTFNDFLAAPKIGIIDLLTNVASQCYLAE